MYKEFFGWSLENIGKGTVETKYIIESITDEKTWNKFLKTEDIDLYSRREYNNVSEALGYYLTWYVNENCYDIKMWEQIFVNGEMVLEQMIEPKGTTKNYMSQSIDREMKDRMHRAEVKTQELQEQNKMYSAFIDRMGEQFKEMFNDFRKQYKSGKERE